jgi:hypothetical protein
MAGFYIFRGVYMAKRVKERVVGGIYTKQLRNLVKNRVGVLDTQLSILAQSVSLVIMQEPRISGLLAGISSD